MDSQFWAEHGARLATNIHATRAERALLMFSNVGLRDRQVSFTRLGIPDRWIEHCSQNELYAECGFDDKALIAAVKELLGEQKAIKGRKASA